MISKRKLLVGLSAITLFIIAGVFLISTERKESRGSSVKPFQNIKDIKIITRSGNTVEWLITARNADIVENDARLQDVRFTSTTKNIKIESPECIYDINTGEAFFDEDLNIVIGNDIKAKLKDVSIKDNILESRSPVKIEKGNTIITGNRIKGEGEKINITGNVKMIIR